MRARAGRVELKRGLRIWKKVKAGKTTDRAPAITIGPGRDAVDHRFARDNALLHAKDFRPEKLVGTGGSFFGSSAGQPPEEGIGNDPRVGQRRR